MTTGLVLIVAILILGGVIATMGDRIGMKVGKSRLSLFGLRPRQTATLITILTGIVIASSTFGLLFAVDDQLRTGVFELKDIQAERDTARSELQQAERETSQVERQRDRATAEQQAAQKRLRQINRSLKDAIALQSRTRRELGNTQTQLNQVATNYQQAQQLLGSVSQQAERLRTDIRKLQDDRQQQLAERDREIAQRDQEITKRTQAIAEKEAQLRDLETQRTALVQEVQTLEREFQGLRRGNVALLRNQPLTSGVIRVVAPTAAPQAVDRLLREANRFAVQRLQPGSNNVDKQVIQITNTQVEQLVNQIQAGEEYVVRILSAGNYIIGEPCVLAGESCIQVYVAAAPNQIVFRPGDVVASTSVDPSTMTDAGLVERINLLIANAQFRARQAGILGDLLQIADGSTETVLNFFQSIKQHNKPVNVNAVASDIAYTAGPVRLDLVAIEQGRVIFSTDTPSDLPPADAIEQPDA